MSRDNILKLFQSFFKSSEGFFEFLSVAMLVFSGMISLIGETNFINSILLILSKLFEALGPGFLRITVTFKGEFDIIKYVVFFISFSLLYVSKKFRRFVIYPISLIYARDTDYKLTPWNPESETRWNAILKRIKITTSESIKINNLEICRDVVVENGEIKDTDKIKIKKKKDVGKTTYVVTFNEPSRLDVNFFITFKIERDEDIDEPKPYLEYSIEYTYRYLPVLTFWDSRRIN